MFASDEQRLQEWAQTRTHGLGRFIILRGVIGWGLTAALLWSFIMWASTPGFNLVQGILYALVAFPMLGIVFGWLMWQVNEKKFKGSGAGRA